MEVGEYCERPQGQPCALPGRAPTEIAALQAGVRGSRFERAIEEWHLIDKCSECVIPSGDDFSGRGN